MTIAFSEDSCLTEHSINAEECSKTKVQYTIIFFHKTRHGASVNLLKQKQANRDVPLLASLNVDASLSHTRSHGVITMCCDCNALYIQMSASEQ